MRSAARPLSALALILVMGACTAAPGSSSAPATNAAHSPGPSAAVTSPAPTKAPKPTPAASGAAPAPTQVGTTQTPWGKILDAVPASFPVFPDATVADPPPGGAVSGAWVAKAPVAEVATWYRDALLAANFAKVDLGSPLEDGSQVLDVQGDMPECKAQVTARPAGGSTMITVLVGSGCASGDG